MKYYNSDSKIADLVNRALHRSNYTVSEILAYRSDDELTSDIVDYEKLADSNRATSQKACMLLARIIQNLKFRNLDYSTVNLAKFGSKRAIQHLVTLA